MSKRFVGNTWEFEVTSEGYVHANSNFWLSTAIGGASYIGGCMVLAPFFAVGMGKKFRFTQSMLRALPMVGVSTKLACWTLGAFDLMPTDDDFKALKSAVQLSSDIRNNIVDDDDISDDSEEFVKFDGGKEKHSGRYTLHKHVPEPINLSEDERAKKAVQEFKQKIEEIFGRLEDKLQKEAEKSNAAWHEKYEDILNSVHKDDDEGDEK